MSRHDHHLTTMSLIALTALLGGGCRDLHESTRRISDHDVLGGARLTTPEVDRGWYESRDDELVSFEGRLQRSVAGSVSLFGNIDLAAAGTVLDFDPLAVNADGSRGRRTSTVAASPIPVLGVSVATLLDEYSTLCATPYLGDMLTTFGGDDSCELRALGHAQDLGDQVVMLPRPDADQEGLRGVPALMVVIHGFNAAGEISRSRAGGRTSASNASPRSCITRLCGCIVNPVAR